MRLSGVGSHKRNDLEVINYDLDLAIGCGSPAPRSLHRPVSLVDWLETAGRELKTLERPPRGSPLGGIFFDAPPTTQPARYFHYNTVYTICQ
jgi:hypothetical protein